MTELMQRRRALMTAKEGQAETVPGRTITIPTSFTTGSELATIVKQAVLDNSIRFPAIMITTKKYSQLVTNEFIVAYIQNNGNVLVALKLGSNGSLNTVNALNSGETFTCNSGDKYYVLETNPNTNTDKIPGKTVALTGAITNGQILGNIVRNTFTQYGITNIAVMFAVKAKTAWISRQFVCGAVNENGYIFSSADFGPCRYTGSNYAIEAKNATSTYDFKAASGDEYYVVEVQP